MDVVNTNDGLYEQQESLLPEENDSNTAIDNNTSNTSDSDSYGSNYQLSEDIDKTSADGHDLKTDLQNTIPECYKTDLNCSSTSCSEITNDEDLQASALCQFMDILNDLDEVLDKSLLACLEEDTHSDAALDSDMEGVMWRSRTNCEESDVDEVEDSSMEDYTQIIVEENAQPTRPQNAFTHTRSKSFTEACTHREPVAVEQCEALDVRSSMRRLNPIEMPTIPHESLTLPVILFLEHHVNMRPTSAPLHLQVTGAGPLVVGRRALSLPVADGRDSARSEPGSVSASSTSTESLNGVTSAPHSTLPAAEERNEETEDPPFGVWPHRLSSMLACLSCTVGIFNLSRFAIFSVHFGANFIVQFFILSLLVGIPLFTLYLCLGQVLRAGPIDMWHISPIFQGVGVALLLVQAVIGIYSIIGLSWIFVYFRDSFISANDRYKWSMPLDVNVEEANLNNATFKIQETIPQYFHGEVLQRNLGSNNNNSFGTIKFQVAFNLAVVWMIVFVALSKGLRSYGKTVYVLIFLPICGTLILCIKLLTLIPYDSVINIFSDTEWSEFFINSNSWAAAAQETFLTWGLLGACIMQLTSHKNTKSKSNIMLQKESACIVTFTFAMLLLASFLANTCTRILKNNGYAYFPGSFETVKWSQFLWWEQSLGAGGGGGVTRLRGHYAGLVGVTVWRAGAGAGMGAGAGAHDVSGWQPLALATQLVPAALAVIPTDQLSPVWAVIFYFVLIMFGIAQQLAVWHCVIAGIMATNAAALRGWETTITFLSCVVGLMLGLLFTTDAGVFLVHFVDYVWVGAWWQCCVCVALACGVFAVRGRPYSGDVVVAALFPARARLSATLAALLAFTWNVLLPVVLCAISVIDFRTGLQRQLYSWKRPSGYWPIWARQVAVAMQQGALLSVPVTAFVQTWRYMSKGPPDILEDYEANDFIEDLRIQNLYRPRMGAASERPVPVAASPAGPAAPAAPRADPPPKYTPPPSYSTATGARLLATLRRSFRTLRRITTSHAAPPAEDASRLPVTVSESVDTDTPIALEPRPPAPAPPRARVTHESEAGARLSQLRRSFVRVPAVGAVGEHVRRSLRCAARARSSSHEQLVRGAEPISSTAACGSVPATRADT